MPRFSVIIPCYNRTQFLREAITSVLNQTLPSFEIVVVDDGSDENFRNDLATICELDNRIQLIQNPENKGVSYSRNKGLNHIHGDYVCFLDDDDRLAPTFFQNALESFDQQPEIDIAICRSMAEPASNKSLFRYHALKETLKAQPLKLQYRKAKNSLLYQYSPQINSMVFRKEVFQQHKFEESFQIGEDIYLWFKLLDAGFIFGNKQSNIPLAFVRVHNKGHLSQPDHEEVIHFLERLKSDFKKTDRKLETVINFKIFLRRVILGNYQAAGAILLQSLKQPGPFTRTLITQVFLKSRILFSYLLYKITNIDL